MLRGRNTKEVIAAPPSLFKGNQQPHDYKIPILQQSSLEEAFDQIELLGFPLCDPFELADEPLENGTMARELPDKLGHFVISYGYLVTVWKIFMFW
jgi:DNA polymerase-3 subunit alpha